MMTKSIRMLLLSQDNAQPSQKPSAYPNKPSPFGLRRRWNNASSRGKLVYCTVAILLVVIIIVPTAVPLTVDNNGHAILGRPSTVLLPLYVYPTDGAWDPLYKAVQSNPNLNFTCILNPSSGPGSASDFETYAPAVRNLTAFSNVQTVGYVRTGYAQRNLSDVLADVATYAGWSAYSSALAVHGIFFDEAPHEWALNTTAYLDTVNQVAKNTSGIHSPNLVIHNPGVIPDPRLDSNLTDITVIFENSDKVYQDSSTMGRSALEALPQNRSRYSVILHSAEHDLKEQVDMISQQARYLFVTDLKQDYYQNFGSSWKKFIDAMPTGNAS